MSASASPPSRQLGRWHVVIAIVLGIVAFLVVRGPATLGPTSILWLDAGDRAMHTLGWWFFRAAPWGIPPGASPLNGIEFANSVGLSDSLPLFAFPFKLLGPLLPAHFQYWGYWHLLSFVLQAVFALLIARELRFTPGIALIAVVFCVFQPTFLHRIDWHMALSGHWTLLAAIYLCLRATPPHRLGWPLLLGVVSAIHGYLLAMVLIVWLASLAQRLWLKNLSALQAGLEVLLGIAVVALTLWACGIFMIASVESFGFGNWRMNVLSLFNAMGWSYLLPDIPTISAEGEGGNYLGLGMLALVLVALALGRTSSFRGLWQPRFLPLTLGAIGLAIFALSNTIAIGPWVLTTIPLPDPLRHFANIFRSSGRMIWPLGYLIIFAVLALLSRKVPARWLLPLASLALALQLGDTHAGWRQLYVGYERIGATWRTPLRSPVWEALAPHYQRVRALPVVNSGPHWRELSWFALNHGMASAAVYLGRVDARALAAAALAGDRALVDGSFDTGAIYALDKLSAAKALPLLQPGDLLTEVDGIILFARNGGTFLDRAGIAAPPAYLAR